MTKKNKAAPQETPQPLHLALRERLDTLIAHLHGTMQPDELCFGDRPDIPLTEDLWRWEHSTTKDATVTRALSQALLAHRLRHDYSRPMSIASALEGIERGAHLVVKDTAATITTCVTELVRPEYRQAVLNRERLVREWPWPLEPRHNGALLHALLARCPTTPPDEELFTQWHNDTLAAQVGYWGQDWLKAHALPTAHGDIGELLLRSPFPIVLVFRVQPKFPFSCLPTTALALLHLLEKEVEREQQRRFIAIDTCKEHTKLVEAWRDLPKQKEATQRTPVINGRLELIVPDKHEKRHFQLSLQFEDQTLASQVSNALQQWRSWEGLRHWVAFQSLVTTNKRLGWVRWTIDEHLKAIGCKKDRRKRIELRRRAAEIVQLFTEIEIGVYDEKGRIRERRPLVNKGSTFERLVGSQWEIEGLELKVNPLLYRGIRDPETGKVGKSWWPTPKEIAHINHRTHGPAIALGIVLPARWRIEWGKSGNTFIDLKGESLLRAAGLPYQQTNVVATWRSMIRNLVELRQRGGIECWEWLGKPDLSTVCRLHAPRWAVDRIAHKVPPKEVPALSAALTGKELRAWRKQLQMTQIKAAAHLGVSRRCLTRAEQNPEKQLTKKLRDALSGQTNR